MVGGDNRVPKKLKSNCARKFAYWIGLINEAHYIHFLYRFDETSYSSPIVSAHYKTTLNS